MESISFTNTGVPLLVLGAAAVILPLLLIPGDTRSHAILMRGLAVSAILLLILSAALLVFFDNRDTSRGVGVVGVLPVALYYVMNSLKFSLFWVPLLALVWITRAQKVERLRGEDLAREDRS